MSRRFRILLALILAAPLTSGCLMVAAVDTAAGVGGLAINATGAAVGAAGDVAEGAIDIVTPGGDKDEAEDEDGGGEER